MSGIGMILDIAKETLLAQKYAIDVVSHNIANVNTPGYTRETASLEAKEAAPLGGVMLGRGVTIKDVVQNTDSFIESRLRDQKTGFESMAEKEVYMASLEAIFSENSDQSLSNQLTELWNAWEDLSNNPSGLSERGILYERAALLTERFQDLYGDMDEMQSEIRDQIETGLSSVNVLINSIADLNQQIIQIEVNGNANDLRDQRTLALTQLAEYMDIKSYENSDGSLTVTTGRGYVLVSKSDAYPLEMDGEEIKWLGSGTTEVTITDMIAGGKIGGWLDIRDEIIPEYKADLDSFAEALIWEVNKVHTQGVGTGGFTSVTSTYAVSNAAEELGTVDSGLKFQDSITDGTFDVWLYDASGAVVGGGATTIAIDADPAGTTLNGLRASLNAIDANLTASISGGKLTLAASNGYTFAFSSDTSHVLAALGINTFFTGSSANDIAMNTLLNTNKEFIAAGRVDSAGRIAAGDGSNALAVSNLQDESFNVKSWTYKRGSAATFNTDTGTLDSYLHAFVGAIGIDSQSITRSREFNEKIVQSLSETRDNISAVSLDEEMARLIQYQHAYSAAAKLVTTAEEMLQALLDMT
jgi:flagellar hook-associated protein 1